VGTTAEVLRAAAAAHPRREAYVHGEWRVTYGWVDRAADGFAATVAGLGAGPGSTVCLLLRSSTELAACYLGALRAGAITSAINLRLGPLEQASILERTEPVVTVTGDGIEPPSGVSPGTVLRLHDLDAAFSTAPTAALPEMAPSDPACVVWTSGTTGVPKGAVFDHAAMAAISRSIGSLTQPGDRRLLMLPFPHVGFMTRIWDELANGTTTVIVGEPWSAAESARLLVEEQITIATGVPTQWSLLLDQLDDRAVTLPALRVITIGGGAIAPELVRRMRATLGCPVVSRYTCTEAGVATSTALDDPADVAERSAGRPAPEVELRIAADDTGIGEVWCRSPAMMRGYWRNPEHTAEVIDAAGWLHTGDLGRRDDAGNLHIVGRTKELYIRGGYNVYPAEVEHVLAEHPAVARVAVVGTPDPVLGEIGVAYVVAAPGPGTPDLATLRAWCRDRIADYKSPDRIELVDTLPVTSMLKVDKRSLAHHAGKGAEPR